MNFILKYSIVVSLLFLGFFFHCLEGFCEEKAVATVLHCYDGDTCRVKTQEELWFNVRLFGIDAQELPNKKRKMPGQPFAEAAKNALNQKVKGKSVSLKQADLDMHNRPVVEFWFGDKNINLEMVEEGWAEAYKGKTKRIRIKPYFEAEKRARKKKLGIWKLKNYESSREFRKREDI
jgi:endonuclease YncB( thermonuclease family)